MIEQSLEALDWQDVVALLNQELCSEMTVEYVSHSPFSENLNEAQRRYAVVQEIWELMDQGEDVPVSGLVDMRNAIGAKQKVGISIYQMT